MATVINNVQSTVGSPYCFYTLTMTASNRTATSIDVSWTLTAHLQYSGSYMGYPLTAIVYAGSNSQTKALKGTEKWSGTGEHSISGKFTVTGLSNTTTSITTALQINSDANDDACQLSKKSGSNLTIPQWTSYTITYNANGGTGAPGNQTKWKGQNLTISSTKPTRTGYTFQGWSLTKGGSVYYTSGSTCGKNENLTLYAVWQINTYSVTYNANGGTGAPGNQTKTYGTTLKLSSTKPTRAGYTFQGWATSASATTAAYSAGGNYTSNAAVTLYAVWRLNTYSVTYNANGGTGAPGNQTKTHGTALKLSATKPTRDNYNFLGWATSASATTATYAAGGSYTGNAAVILYAVWEQAYVKPSITNISITRIDFDENINDFGEYVRVKFDWKTHYEIDDAYITWSPDTSYPDDDRGRNYVTLPIYGGTSGSIEYDIIGNGLFDLDTTYTITIAVADLYGERQVSTTLTGTKYVIDILEEGKGIAFNKPAEIEGCADFGFQIKPSAGFLYPILEPCDLNELRTPNIYSGRNVQTYTDYICGDKPLPFDEGTFTLEILSSGPNGQTLQRLTVCDKTKPQVYERWYYTNAWSEWTGDWIYPAIGSEFSVYSNTGGSTPGCRKDGRVVEVRGIVTPISDIAGGTDMHTIFTVPAAYRPNSPVYVMCQGSGNCTWLLRVNTDGKVDFSRYRNGDTTTTVTAGTWLPFQVTYLV